MGEGLQTFRKETDLGTLGVFGERLFLSRFSELFRIYLWTPGAGHPCKTIVEFESKEKLSLELHWEPCGGSFEILAVICSLCVSSLVGPKLHPRGSQHEGVRLRPNPLAPRLNTTLAPKSEV